MRKHITPSVIISLIALTLSVMGAGYAVTSLPRDSVGKAQIKPAAVGSSEVADGSLKPADFSKAALATMAAKAGPKGDAGAAGAKGDTGAAGPAGAGGSGAGGSDLTVTDANGVVAGTLLSMDHDMRVWVTTPSGKVAQYMAWGDLRGYSFVVSLNADCSPPFYARTSAVGPLGFALLPPGQTSAYTTSGDAPISPAPSSLVYALQGDGSCPSQSADAWDTPPSFIRLDPAAGVRITLAMPLTFS